MSCVTERIQDGTRWGFYGGSFDPPHNAHLALACALREAEALDGVIVAPSFHPPHKSAPAASFRDRIAMCELAFAGEESCVVSDIERHLPTPGYTVNIISELKRQFPQTEFSVLVGADNLQILSAWHRIMELLQLAPLIVGSRPQFESRVREELKSVVPEDLRSRVHIVQTPLIDLSSTALRKKLRSAEEGVAGIHPDVQEYIRKHRLYQ